MNAKMLSKILAVGAALGFSGVALAAEVTVYKSPTCGCCGKWVAHMRDKGFDLTVHDVPDVAPIKAEHGLPHGLGSCHTALVDGYVVEGHVPADAVERLLAERPKVKGIAVPGMPAGSPGMEGDRTDPYEVLTFDEKGNTAVFDKR
jgi:hypothetical protein